MPKPVAKNRTKYHQAPTYAKYYTLPTKPKGEQVGTRILFKSCMIWHCRNSFRWGLEDCGHLNCWNPVLRISSAKDPCWPGPPAGSLQGPSLARNREGFGFWRLMKINPLKQGDVRRWSINIHQNSWLSLVGPMVLQLWGTSAGENGMCQSQCFFVRYVEQPKQTSKGLHPLALDLFISRAHEYLWLSIYIYMCGVGNTQYAFPRNHHLWRPVSFPQPSLRTDTTTTRLQMFLRPTLSFSKWDAEQNRFVGKDHLISFLVGYPYRVPIFLHTICFVFG